MISLIFKQKDKNKQPFWLNLASDSELSLSSQVRFCLVKNISIHRVQITSLPKKKVVFFFLESYTIETIEELYNNLYNTVYHILQNYMIKNNHTMVGHKALDLRHCGACFLTLRAGNNNHRLKPDTQHPPIQPEKPHCLD